MKIITTNAITNASADSTLSGYPASNSIDDHPKKQWKAAADATTATLVITATGTVSGLAIFNIDADNISLNITDPNAVVWDDTAGVGSAWESSGTNWDSFELIAYAMTIHESEYKNYKAVWFEFTELAALGLDFEITITTASADDALGIGEVYLGEITEFPNPVLGLAEGLHDYSTTKELSNGATYIKPRDKVRTFNGRFQASRATEFYDFMATFARNQGILPAPWRVTDIDDFNWIVFARFTRLPTSEHVQVSHSDITFDIIEVL